MNLQTFAPRPSSMPVALEARRRIAALNADGLTPAQVAARKAVETRRANVARATEMAASLGVSKGADARLVPVSANHRDAGQFLLYVGEVCWTMTRAQAVAHCDRFGYSLDTRAAEVR